MSDNNDVLPKMWPDFLSDPEILVLTRLLNISAPPRNEALYSPMIDAVGLYLVHYQGLTTLYKHHAH